MPNLYAFRRKLLFYAHWLWTKIGDRKPQETTVVAPGEGTKMELVLGFRAIRPAPGTGEGNGELVAAAPAPPPGNPLLPFYLNEVEKAVLKVLAVKGPMNSERLAELLEQQNAATGFSWKWRDKNKHAGWQFRGDLLALEGRGILEDGASGYRITEEFEPLLEQVLDGVDATE